MKNKELFEKLEKELELLEFIENSVLTKQDLFIVHWKMEKVVLFSPRLRKYIKTMYPEMEWISDDQISMKDWEKVWENLPYELTKSI